MRNVQQPRGAFWPLSDLKILRVPLAVSLITPAARLRVPMPIMRNGTFEEIIR
jgi:hypothetical protein